MQDRPLESEKMTIDEFLAFTDQRPEGETWELIDGVAVMSPSPTEWHQTICKNILYILEHHKRGNNAAWSPMPGVGTRVPISPKSLPRPDVFVKDAAPSNAHVTSDALIIFEVLSRSNSKKDQAWRKRVYGSVPNCQHYVTVSMKRAEVVRHDRSGGWKGEPIVGLKEALSLPAIDLDIPLGEIYRWSPIK